ncbi:MAG: hypothetical protein AAB456_03365 [Patescibacteria group bacterium]
MGILSNKNFSGGLNLEDFVGDLADNELREAVNVVITKKGSLRKREGISQFGSDSGANAVYALKGYTNDAGTKYKFKAITTKIVEYNTGSWDTDVKTGLTAGLFVDMSDIKCAVVANTNTGTASSGTDYTLVDTGIGWTVNAYRDYIVKITSGTGSGQVKTILENTADTLYVDGKWDINPDGTSVYTIHAKTKAVVCSNGTDTGFKIITTTATDIAGIPLFIDQVTHNGRLWGVLGTKVYWSGAGNGEQWDADAFIDTGEDLVSIGRTRDFVVVYSKNKTGVIAGKDAADFALRWRENTHGCIARNTVASYGGFSLALSQSGVYAFDGARDYFLSRKVSPAIDAIKVSLFEDSSAFIFDDNYYLMYAATSASTVKETILVLDLAWSSIAAEKGTWTRFEGINCNVMGVFSDSDNIDILYIGSSSNSKVFELYDGTYNDSGTAIKFDVKTKEWDMGAVGSLKRLGLFFYEGAVQTVNSDLVVSKNLDGYGFEQFATVSHLQTGGLWDVGIFDVAIFAASERVISRHRPGGRGRTLQYQFYNNSAAHPIEIFKIEQQYEMYSYH